MLLWSCHFKNNTLNGAMVSASGEGQHGDEGGDAGPSIEQSLTRAFLGSNLLGIGTLRIAHDSVSWRDDEKHVGFTLRYQNISLHAIRREPFASLYMMIDEKLELPEALVPFVQPEEEKSDEDDDDDDEIDCDDKHHITELMFAPQDSEVIPKLFETMSQCQSLHPDPNDSFSEDDEDIYEDASSVMDEDEADPNQPDNGEEMVDEQMEGLNIRNGNNGNMDCDDPEQFADD